MLTEETQREFCAMLAMGCDQETACKYLEIDLPVFQRALTELPNFHRRLLRAEGTAEFGHMRVLHDASREPKNWRISVWWLQRHAPERFIPRTPGALTPLQLKRIVEDLTHVISEEVTQQRDQQRILERLAKIAESLSDQTESDGQHQPPDLSAAGDLNGNQAVGTTTTEAEAH
jgi:hypothetical protein